MGIETYILIIVAYSAGCFAAFRLGYTRGMKTGIEMTVAEISEMSDVSPMKIYGLIKQQRQDKAKAKAKAKAKISA